MKLALCVANAPHLKTEQVSLDLLSIGCHAITILALPFAERNPRQVLFQHRPDQSKSVSLEELANELNLEFRAIENIDDFDGVGFDYFLLTGSTLIPKEFIKKNKKKIINCHPGLIPMVRGLDAFKWAVLKEFRVGNTLHFIDDKIDMGEIIYTEITPVFPSDTLSTFALRHYQREVFLLSNFERFVRNSTKKAVEMGEIGKSTKRMELETEKLLMTAFEKYKSKYCRKPICNPARFLRSPDSTVPAAQNDAPDGQK